MDEAPGLKSIDDATEIRKRILLAFEEAEYEGDEASRRTKLTFIVVGGGPTGVELAGALKEVAAQTLSADFRNVDTGTARVILVQAADRLLPSFQRKSSDAALQSLEALGVEVRLNSSVTAVDADGVMIGNERLCAQNVLWAAGVQASPLGQSLGVPLDGNGRVLVDSSLAIPGHPNVFVIGDMAAAVSTDSGLPVPGVAQGAIQSGQFVGNLIAREIRRGAAGGCRPVFNYRDKGRMATIGRALAVAEVGRFCFRGLLAWFMWSAIHVLFLIGFRNRLFVMLSWILSYLLNTGGARLITGHTKFHVKRFTETMPHIRGLSNPSSE
jgi:NADH:ubiquinone reductase (H+-translocating)